MKYRLPVWQAVFSPSENLKSPGSDTVPVRFRLAPPKKPRIRQDTGLFAALGRRVLTKNEYKDGSLDSMDDSQMYLFNFDKNGVAWT